ncbi:MAG: hypothetical protein KAV45_01700 [Calditrichia bacterium]|nr:hypothetical protein [Calditrichia bacterium]
MKVCFGIWNWILDAGRSEAEIPRTQEYWMLDTRYKIYDVRPGGVASD